MKKILSPPSKTDASKIRSFDEAMQIVQSSIKMLEDNAVTRSTSQRKIDVNKTKVCKLRPRTRSGEYRTDSHSHNFLQVL